MAFNTLRIAFFAGLVLGVSGCTQLFYHGDGTLSQDLATFRYVLDLGPFDLSRAGQKTYEISGLPETEFTIGVQVTCIGSCALPLWETKPLDVNVELRLTNEHGETVVAVAKQLSSWTWSGSGNEPQKAFLYLPGEQRKIPSLGDGQITDPLIRFAADGGWGTYFTPRWNGLYRLRVATQSGDAQAANFLVRIQAEGGGWK